jgi:hypothetical protein
MRHGSCMAHDPRSWVFLFWSPTAKERVVYDIHFYGLSRCRFFPGMSLFACMNSQLIPSYSGFSGVIHWRLATRLVLSLATSVSLFFCLIRFFKLNIYLPKNISDSKECSSNPRLGAHEFRPFYSVYIN